MPSKPCLLLTGFEPFGGDPTNPSAEVVRQLEGRRHGSHRIVGAVLPCVFGECRRALAELLARHRPAAVIALGVAAGRAAITPERVAINVDDARIPDNACRQPVDVPVEPGGPAACWSTLPLKAIVAALQVEGIPAEVSNSAGTFVCNHLFYGLMRTLEQPDWRGVPGGFIHLPCRPEEARPGQASLPFATLVRAIDVAIRITLEGLSQAAPAGDVGRRSRARRASSSRRPSSTSGRGRPPAASSSSLRAARRR